MHAQITRILSVGLVLVLMSGGLRPAVCHGWSLPNPFASDSKAKKTEAKEPSLFEKAGTSTKNFFVKTGETLGLKKTEVKKPATGYAYPKPPVLHKRKKPEEPSWLSSLNPFKTEEPAKPKNVVDWMENKRLDP